MGAVALGLDRIGARFAMPRGDLVAVLERALEAAAGTGTLIEAQGTAALARRLAHSVARDRPRARPLADRAVELARDLDDPITLASCLLAQHDSIWTPGTAADRAGIAREIALLAERGRPGAAGAGPAAHQHRAAGAGLARVSGNHDRVLLPDRTAASATPRLSARTRRAALALMHGDIDGGDRLSAEAERLGEEVGESDAGSTHVPAARGGSCSGRSCRAAPYRRTGC